MEKTDPKIKITAPQFEEFLAYDDRGNPVVLRRSASVAEKAPEPQFQAEPRKAEPAARPTGSLRFFAGFDEVRARLHGKLAVS
ncbi:MAG: hypothetical protein IT572_08740 [Deltaproteobacteria bacterium]|nr:hypothetical protein [Deltaproteobacteria bacterium]